MTASTSIKLITTAILLFSIGLAEANPARKRAGQWEGTIIVKNQASKTVDGPSGAQTEIDEDNGWGFSIGYNMDSNWNLSYEFAHNQPRYETLYLDENDQPASLKHKADFYTNNFNLTYHLSQGRFTPYVTAGAGWAVVDSNVSDGKGYCAPGYYWGWYCYSSSYSESNWTYNLTAGIRADISRSMFVRGSYGMEWIDFSAASSNPDFEVIKFELGFRFF